MKIKILLFVLLIVCAGCSSLTKSQTKAVNQYFQTVNSYHLYPEQLNTALAHITLNREQLYPNSFSGDSLMMEALVASLKGFRTSIHMDKGLKVPLNDFDKYIKEYFLLIPNGFNVLKILEGTTVTIAGFFGLSRVVSSAFSNIKSVKISPRKAKKIKAHIYEGNDIVRNVSKKVEDYITNTVNSRLTEEKMLLKDNYYNFLKSLKNSQDSYDYYSKYNNIFIEHYKLILNTEILANKLLIATRKMEAMQKELNGIIATRKKLESNIDDIHELYILMNELNKTLAQFETFK